MRGLGQNCTGEKSFRAWSSCFRPITLVRSLLRRVASRWASLRCGWSIWSRAAAWRTPCSTGGWPSRWVACVKRRDRSLGEREARSPWTGISRRMEAESSLRDRLSSAAREAIGIGRPPLERAFGRSRTSTVWPCSSSPLASRDPTKPVAPVSKMTRRCLMGTLTRRAWRVLPCGSPGQSRQTPTPCRPA